MAEDAHIPPSRATERIVLDELAKLPANGSLVERDLTDPQWLWDGDWRLQPLRAWVSREWIIQLYELPFEGAQRLSVQRARSNRFMRVLNRDSRPISWEELMAVKVAVGLGDRWAVEIYPPDGASINVADMRHLWLLSGPPSFGWLPGVNRG